MYEYKFTADRVVDGDTVDGFIDLGFDVIKFERIRLLGIDTPETRTKDAAEKAAGLRAKSYVEEWFNARERNDEDVFVRTSKTEKFGRYLGVIYYESEAEDAVLNEALLDNGLAKAYDGGAR